MAVSGFDAGARWRVFLSHTAELQEYPKGQSFVAEAERAVSAAGHVIVDMADFPAPDQAPAELCAERVRGCDVYVGILGTRYGSPVRDRPEVSYTELEFDTATEAGLDRLVFLLDTKAENVGIPMSALIDGEFGARQDAFRRRVQDSLVTQSFTDPVMLGQLVEQSLRELADTRARTGSVVTHGAYQEAAPSAFSPSDIASFSGQQADRDLVARVAAFAGEAFVALLLVWSARRIEDRAMQRRIATATRSFRHEYHRGLVLGELAPALPEVAHEIEQLRDPFWRAMAVARMPHDFRNRLAAPLPAAERLAWAGRRQPTERFGPEYRQFLDELGNTDLASRIDLLAKARDIASPRDRAAALVALISHPSFGVADAAAIASAAESVDQPMQRVRLLAKLAGATDGDLRDELTRRALSASRSVRGRAQRARALSFIASQLDTARSAPVMAAARDIALRIDDRPTRAATLAAMLGSLLESDRTSLFQELDSMLGGLEAAAAAPALAASAPTRPLKERAQYVDRALDAIRAVEDERLRSRLMRLLVRGLDREDEISAAVSAAVASAVPGASDIDRAETLARSITDPNGQAQVLGAVAQAIAAAVDFDRAEAVARSITDRYAQAPALGAVAQAMAASGHFDRADAVARSITDPPRQAWALTRVAQELAAAGQRQQAETAAGQAEAAARSITDRYAQAPALGAVAQAIATAGDLDRAETVARSITGTTQQAQALTTVAQVMAVSGHFDRADAVARSITDPLRQAWALTRVAQELAAAGQRQQAETAAGQAEAAARLISDPSRQAWALTRVAQAWAAAGQRQQAETAAGQAEAAARLISDSPRQAWALTRVAQAWAAAGQRQQAETVAGQAETVARLITGTTQQAQALTTVAQVMAVSGYFDRADAVARSITGTTQQAEALTTVAQVMAVSGYFDRADAVVHSITGTTQQAQALTALAQTVAASGQFEHARTLGAQADAVARLIPDPPRQAWALTRVAQAWAAAGQRQQAETVAGQAETVARSITDRYAQAPALSAVAQAMATAGDLGRAETVARSIADPNQQAQALTAVAEKLAKGAIRPLRGVERLSWAPAMHMWAAPNFSTSPISDAMTAALWHAAVGSASESVPPRHVNVWFIEAPGGTSVLRHVDLVAHQPYLLRLSIGELDPQSIVDVPTPFPAERLPPSETGNWLDVAVASSDFQVPNRLFPIFLPAAGPAWVCQCTPDGPHTCSPGDRSPFLDIEVVTPARVGVARLRVAIYYRRNVVQSQVVRAAIAPVPAQPGRGTWSVIDYTLTTGLTEIDALPARAVSFLTNEDDDAGHLVMFNDNKNDVVSFYFTEAQMSAAVTAARQALYDAHIEEYGGKLGGKIQRKNRYDARNAKNRKDFKADLRNMAEVGRVLWDALFADQRERARELRHTTLAQPAVIQVARVGRSTYVFPWALLYELPIEPGDPDAWWFCPIVDEWDLQSDPPDDTPASCPYERCHDELNVLCPYGFWGVHHVIEQPPSVPPLARKVTTEMPPPRVVMIKSKQLNSKLTDAHVEEVTDALSGFLICPADSRPLVRQWLRTDAMELIYFYCHGLDTLLPGAVPQPYLGIGVKDRLVPGDLGVWFEKLWSPQHWERTAPLIFINGCHTVAVTTSSLVQFVNAFEGVHAAGVVGTEITVDQRVASEVGLVFLHALRQPGVSVGAALQATRLHLLRKGNVMGLAYTAYCSAALGFAGLPPIPAPAPA